MIGPDAPQPNAHPAPRSPKRFRTFLRAGAATVLLVSGLGGVPASSAQPLCDGFVPGEQRTMGVKGGAKPKTVARGGVVKIWMYTYRPADENFLDQDVDVPPEVPREPVGNANVTVGVESGDGYVAQNIGTMTDENGKRTIKMRIERRHIKGPAELILTASLDHFSNDDVRCVEAQEYGQERIQNAFVIR